MLVSNESFPVPTKKELILYTGWKRKENLLHFPKALKTFPLRPARAFKSLCPKNNILTPEWVIRTGVVGYFHPPPEQLLRNSECWRGLCNDSVLCAAWQSKSSLSDGLSGQCKRTFEDPCREGRKGVKSGENKEGIGKGIARRACPPSCFPWRAPCTQPLHHAQEGPEPWSPWL